MNTTTARRRRTATGAAVVLAAAGAVVAAVVVWSRDDTSSASVPYHDAAAVGSIGLCNHAGHLIRSGSIKQAPFVWRAVGTTPATGAYAGRGRTATLYAMQPRSGVEAGEWSGAVLTAAGSYTNPRHPMAAATRADTALRGFLTAYPPRQNGFIQLRLYLGAPGQRPQTDRYDALNLKISGSTWRAVNEPRIDCASGTSTSFETQVGLTSSPKPTS